jgi:hypothetical protein
MNGPAPEIVRMWLPRDPNNIFALGNAIIRSDVTTGHVATPIAFCANPVTAEALAEALMEKIERKRRGEAT